MFETLYRIDLWIIAIYMLAMLGVAFKVSDKSRDVEGYTVGNRSLPAWAVGLSVLGTFTSSISFLGVPAKAFASNWNVYVFGLALPVAAWVAVRYFVPLYRTKVQLSAYEFLEARFGYWARAYAVISYIILQLIRVATVLLLVAFAVVPMLFGERSITENVPLWEDPIVLTLVGLGTMVIIYDTLGGLQAVIWTDVLQVLILILGAAWCVAILIWGEDGGWNAFMQQVPEGKFSMGVWDQETQTSAPLWDIWSITQSTFLVVFLYGITENLRNYGTDQSYVQRILAARSETAAKGSIWIGAISYIPVSALFCLIGTALFVFYNSAAASGGPAMVPEEAFPRFISNELPKAVSGIVIAAILAAAMSTVDSSLNALSTVTLVDIIRRLKLAPAHAKEIWILRGTTITMGIVGTTVAVLLYEIKRDEARTILDMWWQYAGTAGGGMFGLFLLAWLTPRLPSWGALVAVICTLPVVIWGTFFRNLSPEWAWLECPLHPSLVGISATLVLLAIGGLILLGVRSGTIMPNPRANELS